MEFMLSDVLPFASSRGCQTHLSAIGTDMSTANHRTEEEVKEVNRKIV